MAGELCWHEPDKTLLTVYRDNVTAEELQTTIGGILTSLDGASKTLHVIVDWRLATDYPYFADLLPQGRKLLRHPRLGWLVVVGQSQPVKLWLDLFESITNFRYKVFNTLEEADAFLRTVVTF